MKSNWMALVAVGCAISLAHPATSEVTRGTSGPLETDGRFKDDLNVGVRGQREWVVVNDPLLPARLKGFQHSLWNNDLTWRHEIDFDLDAGASVLATEVRFIPFNFWNEPTGSITAVVAGGSRTFTSSRWIESDFEAAEHFAILAFVSRVRLTTGEVVNANREEIMLEALRLMDGFEPIGSIPWDSTFEGLLFGDTIRKPRDPIPGLLLK